MEQWPAKGDVLTLRGGGLAVAERAGLSHVFRDVRGRVDERDSTASKFVGDGCEYSGVAVVVPKPTIPESQGSPIGQVADQPQGVVHPGLGDATHHDGFMRLPSPQSPNPATRSVQRDIRPPIAQGAKLRVGMSSEGYAGDLQTGLPHAAGDQDGKPPLSSDESDGFGHGRRLLQSGPDGTIRVGSTSPRGVRSSRSTAATPSVSTKNRSRADARTKR